MNALSQHGCLTNMRIRRTMFFGFGFHVHGACVDECSRPTLFSSLFVDECSNASPVSKHDSSGSCFYIFMDTCLGQHA